MTELRGWRPRKVHVCRGVGGAGRRAAGVNGSAGDPTSWQQVVELKYPPFPNLDAGDGDVAKGNEKNLRFWTPTLV